MASSHPKTNSGKGAKKKPPGRRTPNLFELERPLWDEGFTRIAGVDEAGRGPLAGPVVAAAVIFEPGVRLRGLNDSKVLSEEERKALEAKVKTRAIAWGVAKACVEEIDEINIYQATHLAARRAIAALAVRPDCLITDMLKLGDVGPPCHYYPKADGRSHAVAAASILAKVARDELMKEYDREYPEYGLAGHKGYPTKSHVAALKEYGPSTLHRWSYRPVAEASGGAGREKARRSLKFQKLSREFAKNRSTLEWECSRDSIRDFLPSIEWKELNELSRAINTK